VVSANAQSFGVYAIMGAADTALDQIIVYPVPWRPHLGNPLTGTEAGGITFDLLPSDCTIQIFTVSGQLVREIQHSGGSSVENWDAKTSGGENAASGLYVYLITNSSGHKTGKLIVIR
jgi:flagellar hook assembly protein FlgD